MRYKIFVKTFQNVVLNYTVDKYSIEEGFVCFTDLKTNKRKMFAISNCEIEVLE